MQQKEDVIEKSSEQYTRTGVEQVCSPRKSHFRLEDPPKVFHGGSIFLIRLGLQQKTTSVTWFLFMAFRAKKKKKRNLTRNEKWQGRERNLFHALYRQRHRGRLICRRVENDISTR